jgi:hypothetical protein
MTAHDHHKIHSTFYTNIQPVYLYKSIRTSSYLPSHCDPAARCSISRLLFSQMWCK